MNNINYPKKGNLSELFPHLASQWHPTKNNDKTLNDFTPGSHFKAWWQCEKKHIWEAVIKNRTLQKQGCPFCSGKRVCYDNNGTYA